MRRWLKHGLASLLVLAAGTCARPGPVPVPGAEPELRIGLAVGLRTVSLGGEGGGELFVTDDATGQRLDRKRLHALLRDQFERFPLPVGCGQR